MAEKPVSKHLLNLESFFSTTSPILQQASKIYHELDQLEYELGLFDEEDTNASKSSWWPVVSLIGGFSSSKTEFINRYLGANIHSSNHKFTVHQYTPQTTNATLPGSALDSDYRLPFFQISHKIENTKTGEGDKVNAYLEFKTVNSQKLKGKLFIDSPILKAENENPVYEMLTGYMLDMSDLVLVFTDLFDASEELIQKSVNEIVAHQDSNKFIFIVDHSEISLDASKTNEIVSSWQRRLAALGIHTGQIIVLSDNSTTDYSSVSEIDQRLANIENDRSYRVLNNLEKNINDINDVYIPEVETQLSVWKDRANMSSLIILGFIMTLLVLAEIKVGVSQMLIDPIIGPLFLLVLLIILVPIHIMISRVHSKFIINKLLQRQHKLKLMENLSGLFEKSLSFWRILLPFNEPVGKNKKNRLKIKALIEETRSIVQALNDQFSSLENSNPNQNNQNITNPLEK